MCMSGYYIECVLIINVTGAISCQGFIKSSENLLALEENRL